jgi:hypothetical protein
VTNPIVGVELTPEVADAARESLKAFPQVSILTGNVNDLVSPDWSLYYLFNPFERDVMVRFAERVKEIAPAGRCTRIIYYRALHADVFLDDPSWQAEFVQPSLLNPVSIYVFILRK